MHFINIINDNNHSNDIKFVALKHLIGFIKREEENTNEIFRVLKEIQNNFKNTLHELEFYNLFGREYREIGEYEKELMLYSQIIDDFNKNNKDINNYYFTMCSKVIKYRLQNIIEKKEEIKEFYSIDDLTGVIGVSDPAWRYTIPHLYPFSYMANSRSLLPLDKLISFCNFDLEFIICESLLRMLSSFQS